MGRKQIDSPPDSLPTDRRMVRTRRSLEDALMSLVLQKNYESISVQDIVGRANVGRATFYLHYRDKDDLLLKSLKAMFDELVEHIGPVPKRATPDDAAPVKLLIEHVAQNRDRYRFLVSSASNSSMMRRVRNYVAAHFERRLKMIAPKPARLPLNIASAYLAGALISLLIWWLEQEKPHSPAEIEGIFRRMALVGAIEALELDASSDGLAL
jgi:AcrR family transcriptional regulator